MSVTPSQQAFKRQQSVPSQQPASPMSRWLVAPLVVLILACPIPLASNRPVFWCFWAAYCSFIAFFYYLLAAPGRGHLRPLSVPTTLFMLFTAGLLIQSVPIGYVFGPINFVIPSAGTFSSVYLSLDPGETLLSLLRWLTYGIVFILGAQVFRRRDRRAMFLNLIVLSVAAHALYGLYALYQLDDTILFSQKWAYRGSATGTFVNRNSFATFLGIGATVAVAVAIQKPETSTGNSPWNGASARILCALALVPIFSCLFATQSRMGFAATVVGIMTCLAIGRMGSQFRLRSPHVMIFLLAILTTAALSALYGAGLVGRLGGLGSDFDNRAALYGQIWQMISARPLLGFGSGSFGVAYPLYHELPVSTELVWNRAHSTYLALWMESGVLLGSIPIVLVAWLLIRILSGTRYPLVGAQIAAIGATAVAALHSAVDFSLEIEAIAIYIAILLALGTGASLEVKRPINSERFGSKA